VKTTQLQKATSSLGVEQKEKVSYTVRDVIYITTGVDILLCTACKGPLVTIEEIPRPRGSPQLPKAC
jgi:hypothetical protein